MKVLEIKWPTGKLAENDILTQDHIFRDQCLQNNVKLKRHKTIWYY